MLSTLRHSTDSFFVKILLVLLIASFALWGVGDMVSSQDNVAVATVGEEIVTDVEYGRSLARLRANLGEYFSDEIAQSLRLYQVTLAGLISEKLIAQEAKRLHLLAGDDLIKRMLGEDSRFRNESGLFDRDMFERHVRQMQLSEQQYLEQLNYHAVDYILEQTITPQSLPDPALANLLYEIQEERRNVLAFVIRDFPTRHLASPTDDALRTYYDAHREHYKAPEYRVLQYILLDRDAVTDAVFISDDDLRDAYFERQKELVTPEKRDVIQLLYEEKALAEQAYGLLRSDTDIQVVARQATPTNQGNIELGKLTKAQLPHAADAVFALEKGGFTAPIQTGFGWHIFYVRDITTSYMPSFDSLKSTLRKELIQNRSNHTLAQLVEKLEDTIAAGLPIEEVAATINVPLRESVPIDAKGKRGDNTIALEPETYSALINHAFLMEEGDISDVQRIESGGYFVVSPVQITPSRQRTFEEVRGLVSRDWMEQERKHALKDHTQEILEALDSAQLDSKTSITRMLKPYGIDKIHMLTLKRGGIVDKGKGTIRYEQVSTDFVETAFTATKPYTIIGFSEYGDNALLAGIYLGESSLPEGGAESGRQDVARRLEKQYEQEIIQQYLAALQRRFPVRQDSLAVDRVIRQF